MTITPEQLAAAEAEHIAKNRDHLAEGLADAPNNVDRLIAMLQENRERIGGFAVSIVSRSGDCCLVDSDSCCPTHACMDEFNVFCAADFDTQLRLHHEIERMVKRTKRETEDVQHEAMPPRLNLEGMLGAGRIINGDSDEGRALLQSLLKIKTKEEESTGSVN